MGAPQKIINGAQRRRTDYFRMGRAEAQVACQFSVAVLTIANLLPNATIDFACFMYLLFMEGFNEEIIIGEYFY